MIPDFTDPKASISKHFTIRDAIWLPSWSRLAAPGDGLSTNIEKSLVQFFEGPIEAMREFISQPISVHCAYRPPAYNKAIGGAKDSAHMVLEGYCAIDFSIVGQGNCDFLRLCIEPKLEEWGLRMEDNPPASAWVHLDNKPVSSGCRRIFKP